MLDEIEPLILAVLTEMLWPWAANSSVVRKEKS